jgi:hypothetical protein
MSSGSSRCCRSPILEPREPLEPPHVDPRRGARCAAVASRHRQPKVSKTASLRHPDVVGEDLIVFSGLERQ